MRSFDQWLFLFHNSWNGCSKDSIRQYIHVVGVFLYMWPVDGGVVPRYTELCLTFGVAFSSCCHIQFMFTSVRLAATVSCGGSVHSVTGIHALSS